MKTISTGDVEMAVEDRGSGPVLLLVHGFPLDHTMWEGQIAEFSPRCRTIAPDLPGFGRSPPARAPQPNAKLTMAEYAEHLERLLGALGASGPIVYCGLSMGGYIAWQFWRKFASRLAALVLCDTRAIADTPQVAAGRAELAARVLAEGPDPLVAAMLTKLLGPDTFAQRPQFVEQVRQMIGRATPAGAAAALGGMADRPDVTEWLGQIKLPTLLICGEHDVISPADEMRGIAGRIPGAQMEVIPAAGHMSPLENAAGFNAVLSEFLKRRLGW